MISRQSLLSCCAAVAVLSTASQAAAQVRSFNVPAQPAVTAIPEFARQAQVQIVASARDLDGVKTPAVVGDLDVRVALRRLLAGAPLEIASDSGDLITLRSTAGSARQAAGALFGQILDPATGDYLRDARITVVAANGAQRTATSGERGAYRLSDLPAGPARVTVEYAGFPPVSAEVDIPAGEAATHDFSLGHGGGGTEVSEVVVVATARDGDARAIMSQRQSMDIKNALSTESYGEIPEGNPAEFLKYMPGVNADTTVDGTVRYIGLRGMSSEYTAVTINGISVPGADANPSATGGSRSFSWEQSSLSNLESIEISKTVSADVDANAPAGTINLRTKRAFDRKRRLVNLAVSGSTHEDMWDGAKTGPSRDGYSGKFLPNVSFQYADVFFDRRLGVVATFSQSNTYIEQETVTLGRSYTPATNATGSRDPFAVTSIAARFDTREVMRQSAGLNIDFKATDNLVLSLNAMANKATINAGYATYTLTTGARTTGADGDAGYDLVTKAAASTNTMQVANISAFKVGDTRTFSPSFEWNRTNFRLDGNLSYSKSTSHYDPAGEAGAANQMVASVSRGNFSAVRSHDPLKQDWTITQLSGPDWSNPGSWTPLSPFVLRINTGPRGEQTYSGGALNFTYWANVGRIPFTFKTGLKSQTSEWDYEDQSDQDRYRYVGKTPLSEIVAASRGEREVSFDDLGLSITSLSGSQNLFFPDNYRLLELYRQHPEDWVQTSATTPAEWYGIHVGNSKHYRETVDALYAMGTADVTSRLKVRAGLRWEKTRTEGLEFDPLSASEVKAGGFGDVNPSTGLATTIEGLQYQFLTNPKTKRKGEYDHFFPSASLKYSLDHDIDLQLGYSRTIRRPEVTELTGVWRIDDFNQVITAPNPNLRPEISDNLSVRAVKYFDPIGLISINYYQNRINGLIQREEMTAQEFGYTGTEYADYTFKSSRTVDGDAVNIRGWEFEFSHAMDYLPGPLKGLLVRGSYTQNRPDTPIVGMANKFGSFSVTWKHGPVRLDLNSVWNDDKVRTVSDDVPLTWFAARWDVGLSGSYAIRRGLEAYFRVSNLLDQDVNVIELNQKGDDGARYSAQRVNFGRSGAVGLRARF